jgi:mono/diheme cytochrome c family protein
MIAPHHGLAAQGEDVWTGVYTEEQAQRGKQVHAAICSRCHGLRLDGAGQSDMPTSPAIARLPLVRKWQGQSIASLFEFTKATMPPMNPGSLTDQQYVDAVAYMLKMSDMPSGGNELRAGSPELSAILIRPKSLP